MVKKTGWYLARSKINHPRKTVVQKDAKRLRTSGRYKSVRVVPRTLKGNKLTKTPPTKGYWIKVTRK